MWRNIKFEACTSRGSMIDAACHAPSRLEALRLRIRACEAAATAAERLADACPLPPVRPLPNGERCMTGLDKHLTPRLQGRCVTHWCIVSPE